MSWPHWLSPTACASFKAAILEAARQAELAALREVRAGGGPEALRLVRAMQGRAGRGLRRAAPRTRGTTARRRSTVTVIVGVRTRRGVAIGCDSHLSTCGGRLTVRAFP